MPSASALQPPDQRGVLTDLAGQAVNGAAAGAAGVAAAAAAAKIAGGKKK